MDWSIGFIGAGVMAEVMIAGLLEEGVLPPFRIQASDPNAARRASLADQHGVTVWDDNVRVAADVDLLVLAVKPQSLGRVLPQIRGHLSDSTVVLSIVAGASMRVLTTGLATERVVRCMPNLPCRIRQGMTVWFAPPALDDLDRRRVQQALGVMGREVAVGDETQVDRATAVSGTGPAIVGEFVKSMLEAATFIGENRSVAQETVLSTVLGTAEMIRRAADDGVHVAQLIDEVTSPGGTTSRSLQVLKRGGFHATVTDAVAAAYERTQQLGAALEGQLVDDDGGDPA
jgi:pyrroline-5-carboxylate reductase